ncbi:unnamed protein product [Nezara viridula]|uniref:U3 small nucleolar RNA-associated protein 6 homolog C-terminal domain-containing protein n=1 Tax=Nezara viridula TaxID=85310 RepID=A0A9P0MPF7_NEZVI|nr:unnamed protein product [Nezara viridula]
MKFYTCVSRLFDQMLELGDQKPALYKLAANWEFDECHSIERARKFIREGLLIHKESKLLFKEAFSLELSYINQKMEQSKEQGENEHNNSLIDPLIEGNLAEVIYNSAVKTISNVSFLIDMLNIAQEYSFTSSLQDKILEMMRSKYPKEEVTWDTLARRELELRGTLKERIGKCISVYENGIRNVPTRKMWSLYLNYVLEINEDLTTLPTYKKKCLKNVFETAHKENMLSEKHYLLWVKKAENVDTCKVLQWGTENLCLSSKLWSWRLRYHLGKSDSEGVRAVLKEISSNPDIPDQVNLWLLVLRCYQIIDSNEAERLWDEGVKDPIVGAVLKGRYIEWLAMKKGNSFARRVGKILSATPPLSIDIYEVMLDMENAQSKYSAKILQEIYDKALEEYGKTNTGLFSFFLQLNFKHMNFLIFSL